MKDSKKLDFKPMHLKKLKLEVDKLLANKERENKKIFKKLRNIFKH